MEDDLDVLAFGAHPDDMELMCGATLVKLVHKGYRVGVVALTAGEMGTRGTPEIRRQEFQAASKVMGLSAAKILDIPDGHVDMTQHNKLKVIREIRAYRPRIVFTPYWKTRHPDHAHCSHLVREGAFFAGLKKIDTGQPPYRPLRVAYCMELYDFRPSFVVDVSDTFDLKIKAMQAYQSQFFQPENAFREEETFISSKEFLDSVIAWGQYWGSKIGAKYGEPFYVRELLRVDDPVQLLNAPGF